MVGDTTVGSVFLDSFSGPAADLPKHMRDPEGVLIALHKNPRVSTWDMSENGWLRDCIASLKASGKITEVENEPYPWLRYEICGLSALGETE